MPFPQKQTVNYPFYGNGRLSDAIEIRNLTKIFSFPDIKPGMQFLGQKSRDKAYASLGFYTSDD